MFKKSKHVKESANKKRINSLLAILLVICLVFVGTVLGKYIIDKTIGEKINLNIAGTPQGNVLIGDGGYYAIDEYNENYEFVPTAGFAYQIQQLMETNSKTLGDVTKIVFDTAVPDGIDKTDTATKIDVSHGASGRIYAYYNSGVDQSTVYVVPEELPTDGISYPMMAHENAAAMFAGLYNLETIEGLENVSLDGITDANNMFLDCRALSAVDLSHWTAEKLIDMHYMFAYCMSLKSLDLTSFHTISVEYMNSTFWECEALETIEIDTEKFVTDKVVDTSDMFGNCNSLKAIDVSGFNTENVIDMNGMFSGCQSLETLDVSGFDTSSAEIIYGMFQSCYLLETIDVSNFDIDKVTDLSDMFLSCEALKSLDLSGWDTSNVTNMWRMFSDCGSLEKLDLSTFKTDNVTDMSSMFSDCTSLNKLYLTGWNTENVTNMYEMFRNCYSLEKLDLSSFDTSNVETMRYMFAGCGSLQTIYVSEKWSTEKVINTGDDGDPDYIDEFEGAENELFTECWSLVGGQGTAYSDIADEYSDNYDADNYDDKKYAVIDKAQELQQDGTYGEKGYLTLYEAYTLTTGEDFNLKMSDYFDATTVTFGSYDMLKQSGEIGDIWNDETVPYEIVDDKNAGTIRAYVITNDYGTGIYIVSKDNSVIFANKDCSMMFWDMFQITNIWGLENVDTRNTTNMSWMFTNCLATDLDVTSFDTENVTDMSAMFSGCYSLGYLDVSNFDTSNVTNMYGMFAGCQSLYSLDVSGFNTSKVTNMSNMFSNLCYRDSNFNSYYGVEVLDLSNFDTSNVTNMNSMFADSEYLKTIYAGEGWTTAKVTDDALMFQDCKALVGGQGTSWAAMSTEDADNYLGKKYALIDAAREPNGAKGYLTDGDYGTKSKILLPGGEFNAELAQLLADNEAVTKVHFSRADDIYDFYEIFGFESYNETDWATNADAVLDVARSGNISAFVAGDTVYILAKEVDYDDQYNSVIYANADSANMFRHNVGDETAYIPSGRLTAIDGLSFVNTGNTTDMSYMFAGSSKLATVDLRSFNTAGVTNMSYMFYGCNSIGGLSLSGFDTGKVTDMSYMFYDCDSLTAQKLSSWDVRNVTNMNSMFYGCDKLNTLNLTGWNTSNVTDMTAMFYGNPALTTIYVDESWKTGRVELSTDMFTGSTAIVGGQGTTYDENHTDKEYAVIDRLVSDGAKGYLTYEEAYTLVSGYDFNWMLFGGYDESGYYGGDIQWQVWNETEQQYIGWDGGDVRIGKIVFGSFDEYKDELGITSWDDVAPGLALDAEQEGNIRLYVTGTDGINYSWNTTPSDFNAPYDEEGNTHTQTYYVLSKGSSKIIANEDSSEMFCNDWTDRGDFSVVWDSEGVLTAIEGLDKIDTRYVTNMNRMFYSCNMESLDLSGFNTSNVTDMGGIFNDCTNLTSLDLTGFDTSNVTDMSYMFDSCTALETIDVSKFDTGKVTDISHMFSSMSNLTALDLSGFDTGKVTDMSYMFAYIYADKLDISSFSTAGYPYIDGMFYGCQNDQLGKYLTTIYASELWEPDKVRVDDYGYAVFGGSEKLVGGEGSTWAETAATDSDNDYKFARIDEKVSSGGVTLGLFTDKNAAPTGDFTLMTGSSFNSVVADLITDSSATKIQFGSWAQYGKTNSFEWQDGTDVGEAANTIKAFVNESDNTVYILSNGNMFANADSSGMFRHNTSSSSTTSYIPYQALTAINGLASVNTSNVTDMSYMFYYCTELTSLDVSGFDTAQVTNMSLMFRSCSGLTSLEFPESFNTANVSNMSYMFYYCSGLTSLDVRGFDTVNVSNMSYMFANCSELTSLDFTGFNTAKVTNMSYMFASCNKLTSLEFTSNFNTAQVTTMSYMFSNCHGLTELDLSSFNTENVKNMEAMFNRCYGVTKLDLSSFNTENVTSMREMFYNCNKLTSLDVSNFNTAMVKDMTWMFGHCKILTTLDLSNFNTENVTSMACMFYYCSGLTELDLTSFNTAKVTNMGSMFYFCSNLKTIYVDNSWDVTKVTSSDSMFTNCTALVGGEGTKFSSSYIDKTYARIDKAISEGVKGYLTDPNAPKVAMLTTGTSFNSKIKGLFSDTVTKIQFGTYNAFKDTVGEWSSSSTYVDIDNNGLIRVFTDETTGTVYILSEGDRQIYANANCKNMFRHNGSSSETTYIPYGALTAIDGLASVNTSRVTNMSSMFDFCRGLTSLDLSSFNTANVTDMSSMFDCCSGLTSLNIRGFNTANVTDMSDMFNSCNGLTSLDVSSFDTANVTDMFYMFLSCYGLTSLDVSGFNTEKVTNMYGMFYNCPKLTELDVTGFNTAKVTTMSYMFFNCYGLTSLDVRGFDTTNVEYMSHMFDNCSKLTSLDVRGFNTAKVKSMEYMFYRSSSLTSLDLSSFDTTNVEYMSNMFRNCSKLTSLDLRGFNTAKVTDMTYMFYNCSSLTSLDLRGFNTAKVTTMSSMFQNCSKLTTIYVDSDWSTDAVTTSTNMFNGCTSIVGGRGTTYSSANITATYAHVDGGTANPGYLTGPSATLTTGTAFNTAIKDLFSDTVNKLQFGTYNAFKDTVGEWDSSTTYVDVDSDGDGNPDGLIRVFTPTDSDTVYVLSEGVHQIYANADSSSMFRHNTSSTGTGYIPSGALTAIGGLASVNTSNVTDMSYMFYYCTELTSLDVSGFDTANVTDMSYMFGYCSKLTSLNVSGFNTAKVTNMNSMFRFCSALTELKVSGWNTGAVEDMSYMFSNCRKLTELNVSSFNTEKVKDMSNMFTSCYVLTSLDLSSWNTSAVENMYYMFQNCNALTSLKADAWDTGAVKDMSYMFSYCRELSDLDVSEWNTENVTTMASMFGNCSKLTELTVSAWNTGKVEDMRSMFGYSGLTQLDLSSWNTESVKDMSSMFTDCTKLTELNVYGWNTGAVTNMSSMFKNCYELTELDLSTWNTGAVTNMNQMFGGSYELTTIYVSPSLWSTNSVTSGDSMFYSCNALVGSAGTAFATAKVTDYSYAHIDEGTANPGYLSEPPVTLATGTEFNAAISNLFSSTVPKLQFGTYNDFKDTVGGWDSSTTFVDVDSDGDGTADGLIRVFTSGDTVYVLSQRSRPINANADCSYMFDGVVNNASNTLYSYLKEIKGLNKVNTSRVTTMRSMFDTCYNLTSVDLSGLNTSRVTNMQNMFYYCYKLTSLDLSSFNTSKVTNMADMFYNCRYLTSLNVSSFDTSKVATMAQMFRNCQSLTSLDVSGFDTSNVASMLYMFTECSSLTSLDVTSFDTSKVTNMAGMFYDCRYLTSLDLTGFDTSGVTNMQQMFASNDDLKTIYVSNLWSTEAVTTGDRMFEDSTVLQGGAGTKYNSSNVDHTYARVDYADTPGYLTLKSEAAPTGNFTLKAGSSFRDAVSPLITTFGATKLQFGSWAEYGLANGFSWQEGLDVSADGDGSIRAFHGDTVYILSGGSMAANADARYMFDAMSALTAIDGFENVDMSKATDMSCMFRGCSGLQSLDLSSFDVSNVTAMNYMFEGLTSLTSLELSMKNTSNVQTMTGMFQGSTGLKSVKFTGLDTSNVTNMGNLFTGCSSLTSVDLSVLDTSKVVYMDHLFKNCSSLTTITFPDETGALTDVNYMFEGCKAIKTIDLSDFDTSNVTNMTGMFYSSGLTAFDFKTLDTSSVTTMSRMFESCTSLTSVTSGFNAPNLTTMSYMFLSSSVQNVSLTGLQASKLTDMSRMFYSCVGSSLTVDFTNSVTSVNNMSYMCFGSKLTSFTIKGLDTSKVTTMQAMFMQSRSLHTIDISSCNTANVTNMTQMFASCDALEHIYGGTTNWNTGKVNSSTDMFTMCYQLFNTYGNYKVFDVSAATYYVRLK